MPALGPMENEMFAGALNYTGRSVWESALPGTAVLGMTVEFTDVTKQESEYVPGFFLESFSSEGQFLCCFERTRDQVMLPVR